MWRSNRMDNNVQNNNYIVSKKPKLPYPIVFFFLALNFWFGIDTGFTDVLNGRIRFIFQRLIRFIVPIVITVIMVMCFQRNKNEVWFWAVIVKYIIILIVLKAAKYSPYNFICEIHDIEGPVVHTETYFFGYIMTIYTFVVYIVKITFVVARCTFGKDIYPNCAENPLWHHYLNSSSIQSCDMISAILIIIAYYSYLCVTNLLSSENLSIFEKRYVALANCCDKIRPLCHRLILIELLVNTPRLMVTLWCMLVYIKQNAEWYSYTSEWLFAFHLTIQMCIPAVIAEMVNSQMDSIKLILNEQRRVEKDRTKSEELTRVLRYIKARRLQNDIWHVVPVDIRLPLALVSLCTTYFIVILQFTHLYD